MSSVVQFLREVTSGLPGGGEDRPGQTAMAEAVAGAIGARSTLLIEAGTGTGKSLAYLTPIVATGTRAVVATATIALQGQLVDHDLPQAASGLGRSVTVALLKGRSNYLCRQRLAELERADRSEQLQLLGNRDPDHSLAAIRQWAETTTTGDRSELDPAPPAEIWSAVSVGADECPGANRCPMGEECFAEGARAQAAAADVIVTNHHYYGVNLAADGALLPEHDVVVFDEAHQLIETLGATCGSDVGGGRFRALARRMASLLTDELVPARLDASATALDELLRPHRGQRLAVSPDLVASLVSARDRVEAAIGAMRKLSPSAGTDAAARIERAQVAATALVDDIDRVIEAADTDVLWVDGPDGAPILRRTPLDVGPLLEANLFDDRTVVLTSATLPDGIVPQLGLDEAAHGVTRVGSPFEHDKLGLLYCATDLPDPRHADHRGAVQNEIALLAEAAGGRTLALFTSSSAMREAAEALAERLPGPILVQGQGSRSALVERLTTTPGAVLCATLSFWQGVDVPGDALTLVTIDRIPFPRPDEPVGQARRERAGPDAFRTVDLPRAQTLLAQAAGRLVRRSTDRGVVAVLDPRLATNRAYRWELIGALPPFRRTRDREEVAAFLRQLDADARSRSDGPPVTDADNGAGTPS